MRVSHVSTVTVSRWTWPHPPAHTSSERVSHGGAGNMSSAQINAEHELTPNKPASSERERSLREQMGLTPPTCSGQLRARKSLQT